MATGHRGVSRLFSRALDDVRRSRGQSCRNEDRLGPVSKKEPQPWKPQQLQEENRAEPVQECRSSQRMQPSEESWQQEIRRLKELLVGKDQQICRVEQERRTLAEAHVDTLALLSSTQVALKQEEGKCARLQEQCSKNLDDEELRHQTQLKTKQMVSDLTKKCEVMWTETQRKLEEMLGNQERISEEKESSTRKEIHLLTQRIVQLQQLLREKETKKNQKTKFRIMKFFGR
ncbi:trichohyalin-like [Takifugu flavidus]|uniref:trichohyalin-like n=1 Tax=Takifugu flavidus TaxID=433684 RepID=UPI00254407FA|nr:trichohyalin-like [Takifugu flavidus]